MPFIDLHNLIKGEHCDYCPALLELFTVISSKVVVSES